MFTGLITDIGEVLSAEQGRFEIACNYAFQEKDIGASIACDGCCLTVVEFGATADGKRSFFRVDVSNETLTCTTLGEWASGRHINLERSLTPSGELGGHIVTGHVDGVAHVREMKKDGESTRFVIEVPENLARFIAAKGSVALNGTSLTVNDVDQRCFGINLIPHTLEVTTWSQIETGTAINLEVDLLARYVARLNEFSE